MRRHSGPGPLCQPSTRGLMRREDNVQAEATGFLGVVDIDKATERLTGFLADLFDHCLV